MTRLLLVRHGQTAWNHEGRLQGQTDVALSEIGRAQARRLGERLAGERIDAAYSSDLSRCWETSTIVLAGHPLVPTPLSTLREINLGAWQGHTRAELRAANPAEVAWVEADLVTRAPPGGETRDELRARVVEAVSGIAARHPDDNVLVVSHGGALRAFLCWIVMGDLRASRRVELDNCGLTVVEMRAGEPRLVLWNDVGHLDGLRDPAVSQTMVE